MKKRILSILMVAIMFIMAGCSNKKDKVVTDREGTQVKIPNKIEKIISTAPSNTEVLVDLGLGDNLIAIDTYSSDVKGVKKDITKIDFSNPDAEAIVGLQPDIVIASGHNKTGSGQDPFKSVSDSGIPVVYIPSSDSIDGIYKDIEFISDVVGQQEKGKELVTNMKSKIQEVSEIGKNIKDKKKVYFEIGPSPNLYSFGNSTFLNEMIELIGAQNIFKEEKAWISPSSESVIEKNPDVILTNVNYIENPTQEIKSREGWENINAVKENKVYQINANSSSRPSNKILIALDEMAKAIYPENYEK
ncbi:ABC transporter substrate-binding protein [Romboutsia maritimum]|uniref:ABC transporter substrate-binding protein n=1 Tax=Romboutsia maritimum TaxID=2020948 RepID=A0A371ITS1_9FIRM|nr:ABC transporter substrate-binding protein [Romboutsia maritimum]RDY23859.1 ABC transporter substrate-binding protein [Romboutsia maritimum]